MHDFGHKSMKSREMLVVKIMEINRQHTPNLDFAPPEQKGCIRSRGSSKSRVMKTKVCLRMYFEAFPHTLDSWWLTPFPLPIEPHNKSL
jgi:hypothetical protein